MIISRPTEDGIVFVRGKQHEYLVIYEIEGELCEPVTETTRQIFQKMEFDDCYDIKIHSLKWNGKECKYCGTWCNKDPETGRVDPLRVEIRLIETDEMLDVGYQPEH